MAKHKTIQPAASIFPNVQPCATVSLFARLAYALSDASRLRALLALENGELCVCKITALLKLAPSTVSKHMSILRDVGLVESRKEGRWIYYRLPTKSQASAIRDTLKLIFACTGCDPIVAQDKAVLAKIGCAPKL
jgi:ArsR family transcriptional regulator, arsenate/arsenite/antimonite-responsive transcriptional repressor